MGRLGVHPSPPSDLEWHKVSITASVGNRDAEQERARERCGDGEWQEIIKQQARKTIHATQGVMIMCKGETYLQFSLCGVRFHLLNLSLCVCVVTDSVQFCIDDFEYPIQDPCILHRCVRTLVCSHLGMWQGY